jgi:ketosteroid isomerase-like protein
MPSTETAITRLLDEAAIRDVTARFADAATRGDFEGFRATLADDAEWSIGDRVHDVGADAILTTFEHLRDGREFFVQFAVQGPIAIDGDDATTSCIVHESARGPGETYYRNHCVVSDHLRRSGDGWVFTNRSFRYLWLDTSPFTGQGFPF